VPDYFPDFPGLSAPLTMFSGNWPASEVAAAFRKAGLTKRDMTVLLAGLLTLETVQKTRTSEDRKEQTRPKLPEQGNMGRMSDFKCYIADCFGTRESRSGDRIGKDNINEKNFNKYLKPLAYNLRKKEKSDVGEEFGWIATLLTDPDSPTSQTWLNKYATSNLSYLKDLDVAFNSITQPRGFYTDGKSFSRAVETRRMTQLELNQNRL
jgi:hypothetical protein